LAYGIGSPELTLKRAEAKCLSHNFGHEEKTFGKSYTAGHPEISLRRPEVPSVDRPRGLYERREVFDLLGKYMDEHDVEGIPIFNADNSSTSTVQKWQKTLHHSGK